MVKTFLHVGCGSQNKLGLKGFKESTWREIRFDIDENVAPDVIGSLTDMSAVATGSVDAIYSAHNIEHLYPHEVPIALREFNRVLKDDGVVVITCPDLQAVAQAVAEGNLLEPLYESPSGPIAPIDILYGHREYMRLGNLFMAHKSGFTYPTLANSFYEAGFKSTGGRRRPQAYDLWLIGFKAEVDRMNILKVAQEFLP